jgi:hypothetical protein
MKKAFITIAALVAIYAIAVFAESTQQKNTGAGLQIGTTSTQKIGFWGATPTNQLVVTTIGVSDAGRLTNLLSALIKCGIISTN